ncbi:ATP-dependent RNA helicase DDX31/DBP7 [Gammaproteobacteria bacterium]|nr:ATP-dependent RNA helicase DDX31/DBP7 [Gammaproteobacteria bacterium]
MSTMTSSATEPVPSFADLGLAPPLLKALAEVGYESPSPIQAATIPLLLAGVDIVGQAQTGTGKTAAFALPALSRLDPARREVQVLVVVPTRELAIQVAEAFQKYAAHLRGFHVVPVYGGQSYEPQPAALRRGASVVVGTPGRLIDHLGRGTLQLAAVRTVILDEADEMLQMGFVDAIEEILGQAPPERQVVLFSATMPAPIRRIARKHLREPREITIRAKPGTAAKTRQRYWLVDGLHKLDALTRILEVEPFDAMLVFARTKLATTELAEKLEARGFAAAALNGDMVQAQRERTIAQLKAGKIDILVATDVAARGIDVERIGHVVNFDLPYDVESYVHRIGRTGRAGRSGEAILFVAPRERNMLRLIEQHTRQPLEPLRLPTLGDVNAKRVAKFKARILDALGRGDATPYRGIIDELVRESGADAADLAAALASLAQGRTPLLLAKPAAEPAGEPAPAGSRPRRSQADEETRRPRGPRHEEQQLYRLAVGRSHGIQVGNIVGAIANVGGIHGSDINGVDIQREETFVRLPAGLAPETLERIAEVKIRGRLLAIRPVTTGPAAGRKKKKY